MSDSDSDFSSSSSASKGKVDKSSVAHTGRVIVKPWYILLPDNNVRVFLDYLLLIVLTYVMFAVPFRAGFNVAAEGGWFGWEAFVDAIFIFDLLLNFIRAVENNGRILLTLREIALAYVKLWLWLDLISTIPYDRFITSDETGGSAARVYALAPKLLRLTRLLKLIKLVKVSRLVKSLQSAGSMSSVYVKIVTYVILSMAVAHYVACAFYMSGNLADPSETNWIDYHGFTNDTTSQQYVEALYFAIVTITTVGYGDIAAHNMAERIVVMVAIFLGVAMFTYIIGNVSSMMKEVNTDPAMERLMQVQQFMDYKRIPPHMQRAIRTYYMRSFNTKLVFESERAIVGELSGPLQSKISAFLKKKIFNEVPLLVDLPEDVLERVVMHMEPGVFAAEEVIIKPGEPLDGLVVITSGLVEVRSADGKQVYESIDGKGFVGEIALLTPGVIADFTVVAIADSAVEILAAAEFKDAITESEHAVDLTIIEEAVRARYRLWHPDASEDIELGPITPHKTVEPPPKKSTKKAADSDDEGAKGSKGKKADAKKSADDSKAMLPMPSKVQSGPVRLLFQAKGGAAKLATLPRPVSRYAVDAAAREKLGIKDKKKRRLTLVAGASKTRVVIDDDTDAAQLMHDDLIMVGNNSSDDDDDSN